MPATTTLEPWAQRIIESKAFAHVAVIDGDGRPHVSPVWIDLAGDGRPQINTEEGRLKADALTEGAPVALSIPDPENPYSWVGIQGTVAETRIEGARAHIDRLSKKYFDKDVYPQHNPDRERITVVIDPERVFGRA